MKNTIKKLFLAFLFLSGWHYIAAQPASSAPTPTHDAADAVSLFSAHYTTVGKGPEPQSWGGDAVTKTTISGTSDEILRSSNGSAVIYTSGWTAQKKGYVHLDVYSETGGAFSFGLGVSFSNVLTWLSDFAWPVLPAKQWVGIDVPVIEFVKAGLDDAVNIQGLKFSGKGTYYVDNIYAYGEKEIYVESADIPAAPAPAHNADGVKSVFSDSYEASQKGLKPQTFGGIVAKIMPYKSKPEENVLKLEGLGTSLSTIDTWKIADRNYIHIDVYYAGGGDGSFSFGMNATDWSGNNIKTPSSDYTWPAVTQGQWVSMEVPVALFSDAGLNLNQITQIKFFGSGNFYIDNLYAYSDLVAIVPPTTVPSFTLDPSNVISIFCEQYEEPGYQDSELGMTDLDSNGNLMYYGQNANQAREYTEIVPGNKSIYLTHWNDYPFKIHKNSTTMDLSNMDYLHVSVYQMGELDIFNKPVTVTFWMHDNDGKNVTKDVASVQMRRGEWVSVSIPLCYFRDKLDLSNAYVLRLRQGGYPEMDVYVDNIFAYKGEPIGSVAADCDPIVECDNIVFDETAGELPPATDHFLGVNLASASGGTNPGILGTNYKYPTNKDLQYFKAKGMRLIRLPFRWKRIQAELGGELTAKDIDEMKRVIAEAERLGMWVMPDMHDYCEYSIDKKLYVIGMEGYYEWREAAGTWGKWVDTPGESVVSREMYADVWKKLATVFSQYSNIWGYDLMNEPKSIDINILKNNYQACIDAIRTVDTKAAIVVEGKNYASAQNWPTQSDALKDLTDPIGNNIIYQAHTYFDKDNSGTYKNGYDTEVGTNTDVYKQRLDPFVNWLETNGKKGMLGEFGVPYIGSENSDERYMDLIDNVFKYLKEKQLTATYWTGGSFYEAYQLTIQPDKEWCKEKSTMKIMEPYIKDFHTGLKDVNAGKESNVIVYPNAVIDNVNIQSVKGIRKISVYNMLGGLVIEREVNNDTFYVMGLNQLDRGNYLLKVQTEDNVPTTHKIVKF